MGVSGIRKAEVESSILFISTKNNKWLTVNSVSHLFVIMMSFMTLFSI